MSEATGAEAAAPTSPNGGVNGAATQAPANGAQSATTPPRPPTFDEEFEALAKKYGGVEYAKDKKKIEKAGDLRRMLAKVSSTDSAANEALKARQEADGIKRQVEAVKTLPPRERITAIRNIFGDDKVVREAVEESILEEDAKRKEAAGLSPRERQYREQSEAKDAELAKYRAEREQWERQQQQQAQVAQNQEAYGRLEKATVAALQKAAIKPEHATKFLWPIAQEFDRAARLGLEVDDESIAEKVRDTHRQLAADYYSSLEIPSLADELDGQEIQDPENPTKKTTRAKLLMREFAKRLRAKQSGTAMPLAGQPAQTQQPAKQLGSTDADKMAFWRNR